MAERSKKTKKKSTRKKPAVKKKPGPKRKGAARSRSSSPRGARKGRTGSGKGKGGAGALELGMVAAGELTSHPDNWRVHPPSQVSAFEAVVREIGFVGYVVCNRRTGHVLDGHMRKEAVGPDVLVPVVFGDWSASQERLVLATFNPIGEQAGLDATKAERLLAGIASGEAAIQALLEVMERDVERVLAAVHREQRGADEQEEDPGAEGEGAEGKSKALKRRHSVMVRCEDELDQAILVERLKALGFGKVKRCKPVE